MTNPLYAWDISGTAHRVSEHKPTAGIGISVLGLCGHMFLAERLREDEPPGEHFCLGCLGGIEKREKRG